MNRAAWHAPTSTNIVHRRAAGRRAYNLERACVAFYRRQQLQRMLDGYAPARGELASLARRLGVSKATVSRDVALLRRLGVVLKERMTFAKLMRMMKNSDFSD